MTMRAGGGVVCRRPRATALHSPFPSRDRPKFRCSSTYSSSPDHASFIKDVGAASPPEHLPQLLKMLQARGESIISPGAKRGLIPLIVPLSKSRSGALTSLLRWPTAPLGMGMPVVEVRKHGVWFLAKNVDQYIHRILVEEDAHDSEKRNDEIFHVSADVGKKLYRMGDFAESQLSNLDVYLLRKVGLFPDVLERKVMHHFEKGEHVSAFVTLEFYTKKKHFPGFGRPFVFNAEVLLKVGRTLEAKDAARGALRTPWWTLGCKYQEVADMAQWEDEQIKHIKEKVTEKGKQEDLHKGKPPAQVALDEAAFLLNLASLEGTWDDLVERIANCYEEAGLHDIARFVLFRD